MAANSLLFPACMWLWFASVWVALMWASSLDCLICRRCAWPPSTALPTPHYPPLVSSYVPRPSLHFCDENASLRNVCSKQVRDSSIPAHCFTPTPVIWLGRKCFFLHSKSCDQHPLVCAWLLHLQWVHKCTQPQQPVKSTFCSLRNAFINVSILSFLVWIPQYSI